MPDTCPTVTIDTKNGPVEINEADFDPKQHTLAGQAAKRRPRTKKAD